MKKYISSQLYKYVYCEPKSDFAKIRSIKKIWFGNVNKKRTFFENERDAALWVDKELIRIGRQPVNILKRK